MNDIWSPRLAKLRNKLAEGCYDAAFITKRESCMYISGFTGTSAFLIVTQDKALLFTDFRYVEQARKQAPMFETVKYQNSEIPAINDALKEYKVKRLGFEEESLSYKKYAEYRDKFEADAFIPLNDILGRLRIVKDETEIGVITKAVEIADKAFSHILEVIKPGMMETEVAAELEYHMKKLGASGPSFDTIVASGYRSSMPHGVASEKKLEKGDPVTMDFGAIYKGYCSDMTRTVFLGEPSQEMRKIYGIVLEAQMKALEGAKKGLTGKEIDSIARETIKTAGYGDNFGHGLGHGVGLEIHEEPRLSVTGSVVMEDGMAVTVEPGIYVEGLGGVRIEDLIIICGNKPRILTSSPKELIII